MTAPVLQEDDGGFASRLAGIEVAADFRAVEIAKPGGGEIKRDGDFLEQGHLAADEGAAHGPFAHVGVEDPFALGREPAERCLGELLRPAILRNPTAPVATVDRRLIFLGGDRVEGAQCLVQHREMFQRILSALFGGGEQEVGFLGFAHEAADVGIREVDAELGPVLVKAAFDKRFLAR